MSAIRTAGFEVVALDAHPSLYSGYDTPAGRAKVQKLIEEHGFKVDSVHAPIPQCDKLFDLDEGLRQEAVLYGKIAIETAELLDAGLVALHLIPYGITDPEIERRMIDQGRRSLEELIEYAVLRGIKIALENGQREPYDNVLELLLSEYGDPVGLCYDVGHANVRQTCFDLLGKYPDRLLGLHVHDNTGKDSHKLPFEGNIDWQKFKQVLQKINFKGNLLLEPDLLNSQFQDTKEFLAEAKKRAEQLIPSSTETERKN